MFGQNERTTSELTSSSISIIAGDCNSCLGNFFTDYFVFGFTNLEIYLVSQFFSSSIANFVNSDIVALFNLTLFTISVDTDGDKSRNSSDIRTIYGGLRLTPKFGIRSSLLSSPSLQSSQMTVSQPVLASKLLSLQVMTQIICGPPVGTLMRSNMNCIYTKMIRAELSPLCGQAHIWF